MRRVARSLLPRRPEWLDPGGIDLAAILSATPVMWIALAEASALAQTALVASAVAALAALALTRSPAIPPRPRWLRARRGRGAAPGRGR